MFGGLKKIVRFCFLGLILEPGKAAYLQTRSTSEGPNIWGGSTFKGRNTNERPRGRAVRYHSRQNGTRLCQ
jgi:hypothetical protein